MEERCPAYSCTFAQLRTSLDSGVRELISRGDLCAFTRVTWGLLRIPASELVKFTGEEDKEARPLRLHRGAREQMEGDAREE